MRWHYHLGSLIGWTGYRCARTEAVRLRDNLYKSGICSNDGEYRALLKQVVLQSGRSIAEWLKAWYAPRAEFDRLCVDCSGWKPPQNSARIASQTSPPARF